MANQRSPKPLLQVRFLPLLLVNMIAKTKKFLTEVKVELKKVAWPTRKELIGATVVVIVAIALLATYIGVVDLILSKVVSLVVR